MKSTIVLLAILFSTNTFALEALNTTFQITMITSMLSGDPIKKEAIAKDANEYYLTGTLSPVLAQEVSALQAHMDLSDAEAVDLLIEYVQAELN
jgi:hypothetical protein